MVHNISLWFLALVPFACHAGVAAVVCDPFYGSPTYTGCHEILYSDPGLARLDTREHGFLLPLTPRPSWWNDAQWDNRRYVPGVWANSMHGLLSHPPSRSLALPTNKSSLRPLPGACIIALIPSTLPSGDFATDTGRWFNIATDGAAILRACIREGTGGIQATGTIYWLKFQHFRSSCSIKRVLR